MIRRGLLGVLIWLAASACNGKDDLIDLDFDGFTSEFDCDDQDATVFPGAPERCDEVDNNCNGETDELPVDAPTFHLDADGDTFGDPDTATNEFCVAPEDHVDDASDCDDTRADVNPAAPEVCDEDFSDEDCDGLVNDEDDSVDPSSQLEYFLDADKDGYAAIGVEGFFSCSNPSTTDESYSTDPTDCDDTQFGVNPGAEEVCDASDVDEDCDGSADNDDSSARDDEKTTYYPDYDFDGYGAETSTGERYCDDPSEGSYLYVLNNTDCDDGNVAISPEAMEVCDEANTDENCDGVADDADSTVAEETKTDFYPDVDEDGYGDENAAGLRMCDDPTSGSLAYVLDNSDCDDTLSVVNPGEVEVCDADDLDEDCNGVAEDADGAATGKTKWYPDIDGDSYGSSTASSLERCDSPANYSALNTDCNDNSFAVNPGATEVCDALDVDEDCNGVSEDADSGATGKSTWYTDADEDNYGDSGATGVDWCDPPAATADNNDDCDDSNSAIHPGMVDTVGSGKDEDCDGLESCYVDADDDGYRPDATSTTTSSDLDCDDAGEALATDPTTDCDDSEASTYPGAADTNADGVDSNCDEVEYCFQDTDADGFRTATLVATGSPWTCTGTGEALASVPSGDCDDASDTAYPGATEWVGDEIDSDCNGGEMCFLDGDEDGHITGAGATISSIDADCDDAKEAPNTAPTDDCDDSSAAVYGGATELVGDEVDSDCDGGELCYLDEDDDSYRPSSNVTITSLDADCDDYQEASSTAPRTDCDDTDSAIHPGASESVADGVDSNCDGTEYCFRDTDNDGYRTSSTFSTTSPLDCSGTGQALASEPSGDCNDGDDDIYPSAGEIVGDEVDSNCDGGESCFEDSDDDGFRDTHGGVVWSLDVDCMDSGEARLSEPSGDCNDDDASIYPGATEMIGDEIDSDCNGFESCYADLDNDDYRSTTLATINSIDADCSDSGEALASQPATDCDDSRDWVNPAGTEVCDAADIDEDCDGYADDLDTAASGKTLMYPDSDGDFYGDASSSGSYYCDPPTGWLTTATDCDDTRDWVNPGAEEECDAADMDEDCDGYADDDDPEGADGQVQTYPDNDGDGFGSRKIFGPQYCDLPAGSITNDDDCDDTNAKIKPGATEVMDFADTDCNGDGDQFALPSSTGDIIEGDYSYGRAGQGISSVGDLNNDGYDDIAVGSPGTDVVAIFLGKPSGLGAKLLSKADILIFGSGYNAGASVAGIGDVNGDGYDDFMVGSTGEKDRFGDALGAAFIYLGGCDGRLVCGGLSTGVFDSGASMSLYDAAVILWGENDGDRAGKSVAGIGDVNGDGYPDILIGADSADSGKGRAYLLTGGCDGGSYCGGSTTGLFDMLGASGGSEILLADADVLFLGDTSAEYAGIQVSGAGDLNADGYSDFVIGAHVGGAAEGGVSYVLLGGCDGSAHCGGTKSGFYTNVTGGSTLSLIKSDLVIDGLKKLDYMGFFLSTAGDVNNDGYDDLLVGGYGDDEGSANAGATHLLLGGCDGVGCGSATGIFSYSSGGVTDLSKSDAKFLGTGGGDYAGQVSTIGDVNGDGYGDLIIGAKFNDDSGTNAGAAYVLLGGCDGSAGCGGGYGGLFASLESKTMSLYSAGAIYYGPSSGDQVGARLSFAGDFNGDGADDFMIGAPQSLGAATSTGGSVFFEYGL